MKFLPAPDLARWVKVEKKVDLVRLFGIVPIRAKSKKEVDRIINKFLEELTK